MDVAITMDDDGDDDVSVAFLIIVALTVSVYRHVLTL